MKELFKRLVIAGTIIGATSEFVMASNAAMSIETELRSWDSTQAYSGYTLFGTKGKTYLLDMKGRVAHTWSKCGTNPRLLEYNGDLLDVVNSGKTFVEFNWNGDTIWRYTENRSNYAPHHDFTRIYNKKLGQYTTLYIANKSVDTAAAIAAGADPANKPYDGAQMDAIVEVDMSGKIVWEWDFFDHLIQEVDSTKANWVGKGKTIADYPNRLNANLPGRPIRRDWLHCNSLDYNENLGQIVINCVQGEFYVINHDSTFVAGDSAASIVKAATSAGDFIYRFGDPARYNQGTAPTISTDWTKSSTGDKQIGGAHDIQWIADGLKGAGHFLVFNNAEYLYEMTPQSYIFEIDPFRNSSGLTTSSYVNPPDAGYYVWSATNANQMKEKKKISNQVTWKYSALNPSDFYSTIGSSAQRLPNGNTLICAMTSGDIFEVTDSGSVVWEYIIPVTEDGIKSVITDNYPCYNAAFRAYRYAPNFSAFTGKDLSATQTIVQMYGASAIAGSSMGILPNSSQRGISIGLSRNIIQVSLSSNGVSGRVMVTNALGKVIMQQSGLTGNFDWDASHVSRGLYFVTITQGSQSLSRKFILK